MKALRRILVVATCCIGDVLLVTPLLQYLKLAWPNAALDVPVFEKLSRGSRESSLTITISKSLSVWVGSD